jgi:hypothetical protein
MLPLKFSVFISDKKYSIKNVIDNIKKAIVIVEQKYIIHVIIK